MKEREIKCPLCGHRYPLSADTCPKCGESNTAKPVTAHHHHHHHHTHGKQYPYPTVKRPHSPGFIAAVVTVAAALIALSIYLLLEY